MNDLARLERERTSVEALAAKETWLDGVHWLIDDGNVVLDCTICLESGACYEIRTTFPFYYPSSPPSVRPHEPSQLSSHQYGQGGELCLEIGSDNWHRDQHTAADMLMSAHRLLAKEEAHRADNTEIIPTRHALTQGQELRDKNIRFVMTPVAEAGLASIKEEAWVVAHFSMIFHKEVCIIFLIKLELDDGEVIVIDEIPDGVTASGHKVIGLVKGGTQNDFIQEIVSDADELTTYLNQQVLPIPQGETTPVPAERIQMVLIGTSSKSWQLAWRWISEQKVWSATTLRAEISPPTERLGIESVALIDKTVAIIGLGSVGSKIATSLARTGVSNFILIDDDLLHPANLVRHDSDWMQVGLHKVDAVAERLALINPKIRVSRRRIKLAGQESSATVASAISSLGNASVIIDATANPDVFNLCAHIARQSNRPLIWLEVYAGGIGGLIARSRPDRDPEPFTLRQAINDAVDHIATEKDVEPPQAGIDYDIVSENQPPIIATDAEVSTIAYLTTQIIIDTLIATEPSQFPYPAYLLGLKRQWVFEQPFQVYPIESDNIGTWSCDVSKDDPATEAGVAFVKKMLDELKEHGKDKAAE